MKNNKNELSLLQKAQESTNVITSNLNEAILAHRGGTALEVAQDSDGKDFVKATFKLAIPTKKSNELVVTDVALAQTLERMANQLALGEVASFAYCKELANFADTDATKLGYNNVVELANAVFGLGKSTTGNYRRVGQYFIGDDLKLVGAIPQECSISLLNQLLSYVKTEVNGKPDIRNVEALFKHGIITAYMKQKDYKRILNALSSIETEVELKDMNDDQIATLKAQLSAILNADTGKKAKKAETEAQESNETEVQAQESDDPQIIVGNSLSMVNTLQENMKKLAFTEEEMTLIVTWLDNLYSTISGKITG